jgi:hypothetical protein
VLQLRSEDDEQATVYEVLGVVRVTRMRMGLAWPAFRLGKSSKSKVMMAVEIRLSCCSRICNYIFDMAVHRRDMCLDT